MASESSGIDAFGPKSPDHPSVGVLCPACRQPLEAGCYTVLVALGPGDDEMEQQKARDGQFFNAVAVEVHYTCATGQPDPS